jgi:hypothetical protein
LLTGSRRAYAGDTPWAICNGIVQAQIAAPTARLREQERERSREAARLCIDESLGISLPQLRRARKAISAVTFKRRGGNVISPWLWALPEHVPDDVEC